MQKRLLLIVSIFLFLFSYVSLAQEIQPKVNKYIQNDGTTILFSQDIRKVGTKGDFLAIELHKIFKQNNDCYNAIRIATNGIIAEKHNIVSTNLIINNDDIQLIPLAGARQDILPNNIEQMWYQVTPELLEKINKAQKLSVSVNLDNGQKQERAIGGNALATMKYLSTLTNENVPQQYISPYGHRESFRMFFPGVKPEEIGPELIYKANYTNGKFNNYTDYYQANYVNNWTRLSLEYIKYIYDVSDTAPFILVEMKEDNGGTLVKLDVLGKSYIYSSYTSFGMTTTYLSNIRYYQIDPHKKLTSGEAFELNSWAFKLMSLYEDLHGFYDYGLTWRGINSGKRVQKDWALGPYEIEKVNKDKFKELSDVTPGDKIIAINGKPTNLIEYTKSILDTQYRGLPTIFTIRHQDTTEQNITITPQFNASTKGKTNYLELIKKKSGQLVGNTVINSNPEAFYTTFDPLGTKDF